MNQLTNQTPDFEEHEKYSSEDEFVKLLQRQLLENDSSLDDSIWNKEIDKFIKHGNKAAISFEDGLNIILLDLAEKRLFII